MSLRVLIVGSGPTGMTLALQLQRYGVDFRLIDKRPLQPSGSKALSVNPATLNLINDLGLAEALIDSGHRTEVINLHFNNHPLTRARFARLPSKYPFFLMLPQPDTEATLLKQLESLGCVVERNCELLSLRQDTQQVHARLSQGSTQETDAFDYVVGCDGGLSNVRSELGIGFSGHDYNMHFILADLRIDWPGDHTQGFYFIRDDGFLILLPLKQGYHRIVIKVNEQCPPGYRPTLEEIRQYIARYDIQGLQVSDPIWLSSAPFYNRSASTIRQGRVFLAGDAAHLFSPIGGFGMNSGIADAFNLGWKLGYLAQGLAGVEVLQSYVAEREFITRTLLARTDLSTSLIARLDRHTPEDERRYLPQVRNRDFIRRFPLDASGLALSYGPPEATQDGGYQLPFIPAAAGRPESLQLLGHGAHSLFIHLPDTAAAGEQLQALLSACAQLEPNLRIFLLGETTGLEHIGQVLADPCQELQCRWRLAAGQFLLVRPDLFVEQHGQLSQAAGLQAQLATRYGQPANCITQRRAG